MRAHSPDLDVAGKPQVKAKGRPAAATVAPNAVMLRQLQAGAGNAAVARLLAQRRAPVVTVAPQRAPSGTAVQRACGSSCGCGPCKTGATADREDDNDELPVQRLAVPAQATAGLKATTALPAPRDDLDGHLDLLAGAALVGAPVTEVARKTGQVATVQRLSLNPLDWAKKVWNGIKDLGSAALGKARSLGGAALGKATSFGSSVASTVGSAITGALSTIAGTAKSGLATLGSAAKSALQTLGSVARSGFSAVGRVARGALDGALRLGRAAWDRAASAGRRALQVATSAGGAVLNAGKSLAAKAWGAVKGKVGGLWNGLKSKAAALKNSVLSGAKGLLTKATSLGGKAVDAAKGVADRVGGAICQAISRATSWVYDRVAPLAKKAWAWVKENPGKTIAMLLIPGGPLIALGLVLQKKMLELAKKLFAPVVKTIAAKVKAAWNKAREWGAKAFNTAKQWAGKALSGTAALGRKALGAAANFGRSVLGKARDLGLRVIGKAREWGSKVIGKARDLSIKVWGKAKALGGKLLGIADSLTGGMASKIKGLADKMLGKAAGVLSWVMSRARSLADRALSSAKALASKVLVKAKEMASKAWSRAKELGARLAGKASDFARSALSKGKELLVRAGRSAVDFGRRAVQGARSLAGKAAAKAKEWGAKAWRTAKEWGGKAWAKAKELGGKAWDWTKEKAGRAWEWAKSVGAKLAPYAKQAWEWAKRVGKVIGIDKAVAVVKDLGKKALDLAKKGLAVFKDKVWPVIEKLRQARNKLMSYTALGALCKAVGCAYKGVMPKAGKDVEAGADLATDLLPGISTVKDTCTCLVGENFVTNGQVGAAEQGMACAFAAVDIAAYAATPFTGGGTAAGAIALRTALKGGIKAGGRVLAKEALEAMIKKGGRELAERLGKEGMQELFEKLGKEGMQELAEKMGKEEFGKLIKGATEQGVKGLDDLAQQGAKQAVGEAGERGAKEAGQEGGEKAAKGAEGPAPKNGDGPAPKGPDGAGTTTKRSPDGNLDVCVIQRLPSTGLRPLLVVQRATKKCFSVSHLSPEAKAVAEQLVQDHRFSGVVGDVLNTLRSQADEILPLFDRIKHIPGAENVLKDLAAGKTTTKGAIGELRYTVHLLDEGRNVTRLAETYRQASGRLVKGVDIIIDDGRQVIDFKYYDVAENLLTKPPSPSTLADPKKLEKWRRLQQAVAERQVVDIKRQALRHAERWPESELIFAFPKPLSDIPVELLNAIKEAGGRVVEAPF